MGEETKEATQKWTAVAVFGPAFPYRLCMDCLSHEGADPFLLSIHIKSILCHLYTWLLQSRLWLFSRAWFPQRSRQSEAFQCFFIYLLKVTMTSNTSKSRFFNKSSRNKASSIKSFEGVRWQLVKRTDVGRNVVIWNTGGHGRCWFPVSQYFPSLRK